MKIRSKNLLVTGGAGFIGSNFIDYFLKINNQTKVINFDALTYAGNPRNIERFESNQNYTFINGNICDAELVNKIFKKYKIDGVINFAAESHVDNSINNPKIFLDTNVNGVFNLINTAFKYWMKKPFVKNKQFELSRFHQISTDEVYGSIEHGSFSENSNLSPNSPYSASKASADLLVRSFVKTFGLDAVITRCSNNFGLNQLKEKFIPKVINNIINDIPIPVYGNGKNVRDWIHVDDHCKAIYIVFNNALSGTIYNIAGQNELTNLEIIKLISENLDKVAKINFVKDRHGHDFRYSVDISKIKNDFKFSPSNNFKKNITKLLDNYN